VEQEGRQQQRQQQQRMGLVLLGADLRPAHVGLLSLCDIFLIPVSLLLEWDKQLGLWAGHRRELEEKG
jgi:hypothetical protein